MPRRSLASPQTQATCIFCEGPLVALDPKPTTDAPHRSAPQSGFHCRVCGDLVLHDPPKQGFFALDCRDCGSPLPPRDWDRMRCVDCRTGRNARRGTFWETLLGVGVVPKKFFSGFHSEALSTTLRTYACELFGHAEFTQGTWGRLWDWVSTHPPGGCKHAPPL